MELIEFRITNYRSINDSGPVRITKLTGLVGRNESGKSNVLLALQSLNPVGGVRPLSPIKDFPRQRRLSECSDATEVVRTMWNLSADEQSELTQLFPRAAGIDGVEVGRSYGAKQWVRFLRLRSLPLEEVAELVRQIAGDVEAAADSLPDDTKTPLVEAVNAFAAALAGPDDVVAWAARAPSTIGKLREALKAAVVAPEEEGRITKLDHLAAAIAADEPAQQAAQTWVLKSLPVFSYIADYPELVGHQNIADYLGRKSASPPKLTEADLNFEKMCKVAGLDPRELEILRTQHDHETRNQLANRAGAVVTSELRRLWKDRELKVRFSLDAEHLDTLISDPNAIYDVEVNLDERSRGLKWFFSFYITFSADTAGGPPDKVILLLDEPGLHLHALSQRDLLRHLGQDFGNQIIYTTHSPFMVATDNLDAIRTVSIEPSLGTTVSDTPAGDTRTLFPLQVALGVSLSQSLFIGTDNLVVEGVTDFWILSALSGYLREQNKTALDETIIITPVGGASKVQYMVALLASEGLRVLVLLDDEKQGRLVGDELVTSKLIRDDGMIFVSEAFANGDKPAAADIEDLLDPDVYSSLVRESYEAALAGRTLTINPDVPRIVKRFEEAFAAIGQAFHKTRPAKLLLSKMAKEPETIVTGVVQARMERLFRVINDAHAKIAARDSSPFK